MRRVTSHFRDVTTFLYHTQLPRNRRSEDFRLSFLADCGFRVGEVIRFSIRIESLDETQEIHVRIRHRSPDESTVNHRGTRWRYEVVPTPEDRVWLEMLLAKCHTHQRFHNASSALH